MLASSFNSYEKTHPLMAYFAKKVGHPMRVYLHAEVAALLKCKGKEVHRIHVERYGKKDGKPMMAMPCPVCQEAIKAFGVKVVSYTVGGE